MVIVEYPSGLFWLLRLESETQQRYKVAGESFLPAWQTFLRVQCSILSGRKQLHLIFTGRFSSCNGKMPIQSRINTLLFSMAAPDVKQLRQSSDQAGIVVFPDRSKF